MIDRVVNDLGRKLVEVPVGFKWFVDGLFDGSFGFGGEESAGASFLRFDGTPWSTDKDGIIMCLLAAEITAVTGKNPQEHYNELAKRFGAPSYNRLQAAATSAQKAALSKLSPEMVSASTLAGDPITARLTAAPGNGASIGGLKVMTDNGWFAARPSGTEDAYKIYCESFLGEEHRKQIEKEAVEIVSEVLKKRVNTLNKKKGGRKIALFLLCFFNRVYFSVQSVVIPDHTVSNQGRSRWNRTAWLLPRMSTAHKSCTSRQQKQQSLQLSLLRGAH